MALAIVYGRVSTVAQASRGLSLEAQAAQAVPFGWEVEHVTETASGEIASEERPVLGDCLRRLRAGEAQALAVAKLDQLGRRTLAVLDIAERAGTEGWRLIIADIHLDTGTAIGELILTVLAGVAQLERRVIADRTRAALAAKKRHGFRLGSPVSDATRAVMPRIVGERADGRSLSEIARRLNADGIPTPRGKQWSHANVRSVLNTARLDREAADAAERATA